MMSDRPPSIDKMLVCHDHLERIERSDPCETCPSKQLTSVNHAKTSDISFQKIITTELHSIHRELEKLNHLIHGNGEPGIKTRIALIENSINQRHQGVGTNLVIISILVSSLIGAAGVVASLLSAFNN